MKTGLTLTAAALTASILLAGAGGDPVAAPPPDVLIPAPGTPPLQTRVVRPFPGPAPTVQPASDRGDVLQINRDAPPGGLPQTRRPLPAGRPGAG